MTFHSSAPLPSSLPIGNAKRLQSPRITANGLGRRQLNVITKMMDSSILSRRRLMPRIKTKIETKTETKAKTEDETSAL